MPERPLRVLYSVGSLDRGGIETWLMNILRQQSEEITVDFILGISGGVFEDEAKSYGCQMYYLPQKSRLQKRLDIIGLGKRSHVLEDLLEANRYDVFHAHGDEFFGDAMKTAARSGVPVRVAHCHNTHLARGKKGPEMALRRLRFDLWDRFLTRKYSTDIVACSNDAGQNFMGKHWATDPRCKTVYCGVPIDHFKTASKKWAKDEFRKKNGIPCDAIVIGHVGSMDLTPQKNHEFLLKIFIEISKRDERYCLYMAGDGPRRAHLVETVRDSGLQGRIFLPGLCDDVPSLMVHGFDVHLLPSLFEGLPVVGLEAVASGLHTVCSDTITADFTDYFCGRVTQVALSADISVWVDKVMEGGNKKIPAHEGVAIIERSPFSIKSSLNDVLGLYKHRLMGNRFSADSGFVI